MPEKTKSYDRAYFDRWYRDPADRVSTREALERKVRMAVSLAEFLLGREIQNVLDVGCGEAPWWSVLRKLRPDAKYIGIDSSDYVLERFGKARNIRRGSFGELDSLKLPRTIDLFVCADVLQYVPPRDVSRGIKVVKRTLTGVAYIETFTTADVMEGDRDGWHERSAAEYRRMFRGAGLTQCGPYCWTDLDELDQLNEFEYAAT